MGKIIYIGSDHAGYNMKKEIVGFLTKSGKEVVDLGTDSTESVDYPVFADKVCNAVNKDEGSLGILICGTGVGMSIAANKHIGIRAALCGDTFSAKFTRMHNDSNVLCMGARVIGEGLAEEIVTIFTETSFEGGRHQRRVDMLNSLDKK